MVIRGLRAALWNWPGDCPLPAQLQPVVKWRQILAKGGANHTGSIATGAARKKAIVAVARQLAVDLCACAQALQTRSPRSGHLVVRGEQKENTLLTNKNILGRGRCPVLTCSERSSCASA